jgi:hypothetical protein
MTAIQVEIPKHEKQSQTIGAANFMRIFCAIVSVVTVLGETGVLLLLPEKIEKPVSYLVMCIGFLAICLGANSKGTKIIEERLSRPTVFSAPGRPGVNASGAKLAVYLSAAELLASSIRDQIPQEVISAAEEVRDQEVGVWGGNF